jgi:GT2 family glycosyltransferase
VTTSGAPRPTLDIIVVNYNAGGQLRACLESIPTARTCGFDLARVVVVDNASTDGSANGLEPLPVPLTLVRNATNRGFAAACNQAAASSTATYLLFLNPDTRLFADSLARPVWFLEAPANRHIGIVGVQLLDEHGVVTPTCARFLTPAMIARKMVGLEHLTRGVWTPHVMVDWDHRSNRVVDHVMGAFFLVRRETFDRLGRFDERFFVYLEDLDFSLRAKQAGVDSYYLADTQIYHRGGGVSHRIKARSLQYALTSRLRYGYKHFNRGVAVLLALGTFTIEPIARLAFALLRGSPEQLADTLKAYAMLWSATLRRALGRSAG